MKSCFFIGHRDAPDAVLAHLTVTLERLIVEESVGYFYVGQYGSFDRLAALALKRLKQRYPFILLMLLLPYHPADRPNPTPPGFDGTYYPEGMLWTGTKPPLPWWTVICIGKRFCPAREHLHIS